MNYDEFSQHLKKLSVSKKEFAEETGLSQSSVTNWKSVDNVPSWVEPYLEKAEKALAYETVKNIVDKVEGK